MGLLDRNVCPKCGEQYSIFKSACPKCGTRKRGVSNRASAQSDTARRGSPAQSQHDADSRWQLIFGLGLVAAVIIAVIILIVTAINGDYETYEKESPSQEIEEEQEPETTPTPTPTPIPTPAVESITITFLGGSISEFTLRTTDTPIQLGATVYPVETDGTVTWTSSDTSVCTVDETGLVTAVGSGWATVYASCYGAEASCDVLVP